MSKQHVIIVGAGIGGIATAALLGKAGYRVSVYEKNARPGGRADTFSKKGFTFDMGPSWYLMPEVFKHFYELVDENVAKQLILKKLDPAYKVFFEGEVAPITITSNKKKDSKTFETIETGAGAALNHYVSRGEKIYNLSLKHFLYSNFTSVRDFIKKDIVANIGTMGVLAFMPIDRYVSRFVRDIRLQQILEYPMVFLGTSPFNAPALYSLMSALDFREGVFYPQGGIYKIIESLVAVSKKYDVTYYFNTPVEKIMSSREKATGVRLVNKRTIDADIVISNADLHFTENTLLVPTDRSYPESYWHKKQAGPSALLMYLGIKGTLPNLEHHNLLFADAWKQNFTAIYQDKTFPQPASLYICKPSGIDPSVAPRGYENMFVLVPLPAGKTMSVRKQAELSELYLDQIATMIGVPDLKKRIAFKEFFGPSDFMTKFHSWQSTALGPSHILRQSAMFRTPNKSRKLHNLYYVGGSTTPGIGLPMCLIGAELIYKRLAGDKVGGRVTSIKPIGERD